MPIFLYFILICHIHMSICHRVQAVLWAVSIYLPQIPHQHPDIAGIAVAEFSLSQKPVAGGLCHSGIWVSWSAPICVSDSLKRLTNKIQGKTSNVCGKTNGQILLVSTGNCNSGWETVAPGYVQPFSGINRDKVLWDLQEEWKYWVSCQGLHNAFDFPPFFAVSWNEWDGLKFWPRIREFCEIAWCRLK